jgi:hypothetical protein
MSSVLNMLFQCLFTELSRLPMTLVAVLILDPLLFVLDWVSRSALRIFQSILTSCANVPWFLNRLQSSHDYLPARNISGDPTRYGNQWEIVWPSLAQPPWKSKPIKIFWNKKLGLSYKKLLVWKQRTPKVPWFAANLVVNPVCGHMRTPKYHLVASGWLYILLQYIYKYKCVYIYM